MPFKPEVQARINPFVQIIQFFFMLVVMVGGASVVGYGLNMIFN